jgi:hypothetical protein
MKKNRLSERCSDGLATATVADGYRKSSPLLPLVRQMTTHFLDVGLPKCRSNRVVGADRLPGVAEAIDVAGENPGTNVDVGARVEELPLGDAVEREPGKPCRIDLHEPDIARSIAVPADCLLG